jgi:alkylation response protein AidB-like acyl-CoA dehydrogenase
MNFLLSEQQLEIQNTVARFLADNCTPEHLQKEAASADWLSKPLWQQFCELGFAGIGIPENYQGVGLEMIDIAIIAEEMGRAAAPLPFMTHSLCALAISEFGSAEQKQQWLPKLASGEILGSIAIAENDGNWSPENSHLAGGSTLSGTKRFVPFASHADLLVVSGSEGRLYLSSTKDNHVTITNLSHIDPAQPLADVCFNNSGTELLGDCGSASRLRNAALILLAADAFGVGSKCVSMAVEYANTRQQFGRPIGSFQGLKHQLANMSVAIEPSRGLYWYAAHAYDQIKNKSEEASALAKAHLCDTALQVARDAVEAHGGIGYTWEYSLQLYVKRAMVNFAYYGNPSQHRKRVALLSNW